MKPITLQSRQAARDVRDGDWYCPGCGDFQFGRNSTCRLCAHPKPEKGALAEIPNRGKRLMN
eukprot:8236346-Karenia_brevis.AAC.1